MDREYNKSRKALDFESGGRFMNSNTRSCLLTVSLFFTLIAVASAPVVAGQAKVEICHLAGKSGKFNMISVAAPAVEAHIKHGDHFPYLVWADGDGDGYGAGASSNVCVTPTGYVENGDDCDDSNAAVNPAAEEVCNAIDDDCDGAIDEGLTFDLDGDGYTTPDSCEGSKDDCDDADAAINPGASEACNGVDDDCDGAIDEGLTFDLDGDGYSTPASCEGSKDDCDDGNASVNPGAAEFCNGTDDDCDGSIDEGLTFDADGDGYTTDDSCEGSKNDCDDGDPAINPGATEVCDGDDNDCDGAVDEGGVCGSKTVFVSSLVHNGNFGGLAAADAWCQQLANNAGLGGTYVAWLSGRSSDGANSDGQDVTDRFTPSAGPYELVNGTKVADSFADLTDGTLDHAIDRTEVNLTLSSGDEHRVWTNTLTNGLAFDYRRDCAGGGGPTTWTCSEVSGGTYECRFESGAFGIATSTTASWTHLTDNNTACDNLFRLYCFEQ